MVVRIKSSKVIKLKAPKLKRDFDYFVFFDVETKTDENNNVRIMYLAYYIYDIFLDTITDRRILTVKEAVAEDINRYDIIVFDSEEKLKNFFTTLIIKLVQYKEKTSHIIVSSHNLHFDKIAIDFEQLIKNNFELKSFDLSKNFIMTYVKKTEKARYYIHFVDNTNFFKTSLKKLAKSFELQKLEIESDYSILNKNNINYVYTDVEILFRAFTFVYKMFKQYTNTFKFTIASNSFNIVKKYIEKFNIEVHNIEDVVNLEKISYRGGRTETHMIGILHNKVYKLDVNSLYPYVMKEFKYPTKLEFFIDYTKNYMLIRKKTKNGKVVFVKSNPIKVNLDELIKNDYEFIIDAEIEQTKNVIGIRAYLQKHKDYNFIFKSDILKSKFKLKKENLEKVSDYDLTLTFSITNIKVRTVITSAEIKLLKNYIKIHKIYRIAIYSSEYIFKDFVEEFYSKRLKAKEEKKDALQLFYKIVLNASYGKFGQVNKEFIEVKEESVIKEVMSVTQSRIYDEVRIDGETYIIFNNKVYKRSPYEIKSIQSFIAIASFITAYARAYITKLMLKALQKGKVYYMDTDSLFVDENAYEELVKEGFVDNKKLGKLKLEGVYDGLIVVSEKQYALLKDAGNFYKVELKFKGIRLASLLDYLRELNVIRFSKDVDSAQNYYYIHREIDFDILLDKSKELELFYKLLNYDVEDFKFTKTVESLRKYKNFVVKLVIVNKRRRAVKFKNKFIKVSDYLYFSKFLF